MTRFLADDLLAGARLCQNAGQVAHRSRWNKQCRFATKDFCCTLLKAINGRVFNEDVIADLGVRHRSPHFRRWLSYGVASEVDNRFGHSNSSVMPLASSHPAGVSLRCLPSN